MFVMNVYDNVNSSCIKQAEQTSHMYAVRTYFSNYCNKNLILLLFWIVDKLETCLRISLVGFFFEENLD
jgi:hypothetical protein